MRALAPQPSVLVPALAPGNSRALQGGQPSIEPFHALEPQLFLSRPWRRFTWPHHRVVNPHHNHCLPLSRSHLYRSRPSRRLIWSHHRVVNPHHQFCVPVTRSHVSSSQPWRQLTRPHSPQEPRPAGALNALDYGLDDNLVLGFTDRWVHGDNFVAKASEVYSVHKMATATPWVEANGTERSLAFEE